MRMLFLTGGGLVVAGLLTGCHAPHAKSAPANPPANPAAGPAAIVTPAQTAAAYVIAVNESARFVVLNFPSGQPLAPGQVVGIYRNGLKTAEVKISGPQQDNNIVGDILSGDVRKGDDARGE